jgi:hypothetical protein
MVAHFERIPRPLSPAASDVSIHWRTFETVPLAFDLLSCPRRWNAPSWAFAGLFEFGSASLGHTPIGQRSQSDLRNLNGNENGSCLSKRLWGGLVAAHSRRTGVVRRSQGPRIPAPGSAETDALSLPHLGEVGPRRSIDRSAQAAVEGVAAANSILDTSPDPAAFRGPWVPQRPVHPDICRSACWTRRGLADGLAGFLPVNLRRQNSGLFPHRGLSRIRRRSAGRHLQQCHAERRVEPPRARHRSGQLREACALYARPHLPQGAPTSPALANLCAYRADCRLAGLAKRAGTEYSRYADDPAFSGDEAFARHAERFSIYAAAILHEEGFAVNHRKTRIMRQGVRQHLAGLAVSQRVNVIRADFDRLKATLTNCARLGPESQNRDAHASFRAHLGPRRFRRDH